MAEARATELYQNSKCYHTYRDQKSKKNRSKNQNQKDLEREEEKNVMRIVSEVYYIIWGSFSP